MRDDQIPTSDPVQPQAAGERPAAERDALQKVAPISVVRHGEAVKTWRLLRIVEGILLDFHRPGGRDYRHPSGTTAGTNTALGLGAVADCLIPALAGVDATVPGIPTIPFLLSTSYFPVRSSPRLNFSPQRLRRLDTGY